MAAAMEYAERASVSAASGLELLGSGALPNGVFAATSPAGTIGGSTAILLMRRVSKSEE